MAPTPPVPDWPILVGADSESDGQQEDRLAEKVVNLRILKGD